MNIKRNDLLKIYEMMWRIRKFEEKAIELYSKALIGGSIHTYIGEEAIAATIGILLRKDDFISSTHRGHGHILGKGTDPKEAMAELLGKATGSCKGRGGSMHIADFDNGILGANGIVGGGIPMAVGAGLSAKMRGTDQVSVAYFGDGASNRGDFHEAMNLATVWELPVIFACENNGFGMTVPIDESTKEKDIYLRSKGYGMQGVKVDGNDVLAIYKEVSKAIQKARKGNGPTFIEFKTYRWRGHWEGDAMNYRDAVIAEKWITRCPIKALGNTLVKEYQVDEDQLKQIEASITEEIVKASEFALNSPDPDASEALNDVFTEAV